MYYLANIIGHISLSVVKTHEIGPLKLHLDTTKKMINVSYSFSAPEVIDNVIKKKKNCSQSTFKVKSQTSLMSGE